MRVVEPHGQARGIPRPRSVCHPERSRMDGTTDYAPFPHSRFPRFRSGSLGENPKAEGRGTEFLGDNPEVEGRGAGRRHPPKQRCALLRRGFAETSALYSPTPHPALPPEARGVLSPEKSPQPLNLRQAQDRLFGEGEVQGRYNHL